MEEKFPECLTTQSTATKSLRVSMCEHRSINIGISSHSRILLVVFTDRRGKVRVISSRKATAKERKLYETY